MVRIHSGSPNISIKTIYCDICRTAICKIVQDFATSVREHVKNTGTKPVQFYLLGWGVRRYHEKKNPRSAATETGIKSHIKAISFRILYSIEQELGATIGKLPSPYDEVQP